MSDAERAAKLAEEMSKWADRVRASGEFRLTKEEGFFVSRCLRFYAEQGNAPPQGGKEAAALPGSLREAVAQAIHASRDAPYLSAADAALRAISAAGFAIVPKGSVVTDEMVEVACAAYTTEYCGGEAEWPDGWNPTRAPDHRSAIRAALLSIVSGGDEDMAAVGRSLMEAIDAVMSPPSVLSGWAPANDPAEIVTDLYEMLREARDRELTAVDWAVSRWFDEVSHRPLVNIHRRTLDDTWRQVIRHFGGDPDDLLGPDHDTRLAGKDTTR